MRRIVIVLFLTAAASVGTVAPFDSPAQADPGFNLPWSAGEAHKVVQGWGGPTHACPGGNCYAYDFGLPDGTPVGAAAGGTVTAADGSHSAGGCDPAYNAETNHVRILHGDGSSTVYLHLKDVLVWAGQEVERGQLIGHSGQTGYACGAHLHFQRDVGGTSAPVYFDEYPGQPLNAGQSATSQNSRLPDGNGDWLSDLRERFAATTLACGAEGWPPDPLPLPNGNGVVEIDDVFFVTRRFGASEGDSNYSPRAEIASRDGFIGADDVFAFASRFGQRCR